MGTPKDPRWAPNAPLDRVGTSVGWAPWMGAPRTPAEADTRSPPHGSPEDPSRALRAPQKGSSVTPGGHLEHPLRVPRSDGCPQPPTGHPEPPQPGTPRVPPGPASSCPAFFSLFLPENMTQKKTP